MRARRGYVLVPVVLGLSLIAITAVLIAGETALSTDATSRLLDPTTAEHLAQSGLARARWQARHGECTGGGTVSSSSLAGGSYEASITGSGSSTRYVLDVDQDAWIRSDDVDRNNGSNAWNHVRSEGGKYEQVLTRFDLSALPAGGTVSSAVAWFYIKTGKPHPEGDIWVHEIMDDWTEIGVTWETFDAAFSSVRIATIPAQDAGQVWVGINLTAQVQAWLNGRPNYGILFRSKEEGIHAEYTGRAEGSNPPRLEVTIAAGEPSPVDLVATGMLPDGVMREARFEGARADQTIQVQTLRPVPSEAVDTYLWENKKNTNYATADETWVATGNNNEAHAVFRFAMTAIPAGASIIEATLSLHHRDGNDPDVPISAHRILSSWLEDESNWKDRSWEDFWSAEGGDFDPTPVSTTLVGPTNDIRYEWDVTSLVQGWVDGAYPNYGLLLDTTAPGIFGERFETSDHADPTRRPSLTVRYACECGTVCLPPRDSGNLLMVVRSDDLIAEDEEIRQVLEDWGYVVTVINDDDSQAQISSAAAAADVVFVSESVQSSAIGSKLDNLSTGIVTAEGELSDDLGIGDGLYTVVTDTVEILENDHFITSVFRLGPVLFKTVDSEMYGVQGSAAPGGAVLATVGSAPGVVAVDAGAALAGGGTSPGKRVLVPVGKREVGWDVLTNAGAVLVQRALAWAKGEGEVAPPALLLVVANDGSLTFEEQAKRTQIEAWGFEVTLIDEDDNQAAFDAALEDVEVVFVTEDVRASDVNTKLTGATVGVVTEEVNLADDLGLADETEWDSGTVLDIQIADHYITDPFPIGNLTVLSTSESLVSFEEDLAPDLVELGSHDEEAALLAVAQGAAIRGGGTAAGRRVLLPWGGNDMSLSSLSPDGLTLFRRALEWGAGADLPAVLPLAHWKLDETSGTTAADDIGTHDGTLVDTPEWGTGQVDGGLKLDGVDDYVTVAHDTGLDLTTFSIGAWIQASALSGWQIVVNKGTTTNAVNYYLATNGDEIGLGYYNGGWIEFNTTSANLSTGTWFHVVATYDDATRQGTIYLDGVEVHQSTVGTSPVPNTDDLTIGRSAFGEYWPGTLDDVRLYDEVLGATRVLELYQAGSGGGGGSPPPGGPCNGTYRDEFDAEVFAGSNGTIAWSATPWQEVGESDGAENGDVEVRNDVSNYQLRIRDNNNGGEGVERRVDLDGATSASISLQYRREDLDNGNDYVALLISTNGLAGPWSEIDRFGTDNDATYQSYTRDISGWISANTAIRLRSSPNMGNNDIVWFDDIEVSCSP